MKALVVSQYWWPENGVPQRRWQWLSQVLSQEGHQVTAIAPPPHYPTGKLQAGWKRASEETGPAGETIVRARFRPHARSLTDRALSQAYIALSSTFVGFQQCAIKRSRPDILFGTVPALPTACVTAFLGLAFKIPYVIDLRDAWPQLFEDAVSWNKAVAPSASIPSKFGDRVRKVILRITRAALEFSFRHATAIIVTAESLTVDNKRILTVRNVFPSGSDLGSPLIRQPDADRPSLRILYAGTLGRAQNLRNALEAFTELQKDYPDVEMRIVGGGVAKDELKSFAKEHSLSVDFFARVPAEEMPVHYAWADTALVHLTNWKALTHTVPSKTYELMELGVHITGVVEGEAARIINENRAGIVVAPEQPELLADAWRRLINEPNKLKMPGDGAAWVKHQRDVTTPEVLSGIMDLAKGAH